MEKFYKTYSIKFEIGDINLSRKPIIQVDQTLFITYPLTAEFSIGRSISKSANTATINIYGLGEDNRTLLFKNHNDKKKYIMMTVSAGYGGNLYDIYKGMVDECYTVRDGGATEYKTVIYSDDTLLDMYFGKTSLSYNENAKTSDKLRALSADLITLQLALISPNVVFSQSKRGENITGTSLDEMRRLSINLDGDITMSVDNGKVYFLNKNDVVASLGKLAIDCDMGLLGSPRWRNEYITAEVLFEPQAMLNQIASLSSVTMPNLNQDYKIMSIAHDGVISGAKDSALTTTLELWCGVGRWINV